MYHTESPTDKTIREWYMNSSRVAACALRNEQAVQAHGPGRPMGWFNDVIYLRDFEFLTAVLLNVCVCWDVTPCRLVNIYRRFEISDSMKTLTSWP